MAILKRNKTSVFGLVADLVALQQADTAEQVARSAGDDAVSTRLTAETDARIAGDTAQGVALQEHINGAFSTAKNLLDVVNGDATSPGSFRKAIADLIGGAPVALDTLKEIADYIAVNPEANVAAAITAQVEAAVARVNGTASAAMDTMGEIEAAINAEIINRVTADTALRAYADSVAAQGGSAPKIESVLVNNNRVVLSFAPKNAVNGILNFSTVRYIDANGVAYDAPVSLDATDVTGKTFIVSVDVSGEWDTQSVQVQYLYVAA